MIIDLSVHNFRSFQDEQMFSMSAESNRLRHPSNYSLFEDDRIAVLRTAAILGANASGKSNLLLALGALKWIILSSGSRKDGQPIPPYEPFRLSADSEREPVGFEVEFVVPSGTRYRYEVSFLRERIVRERLQSFQRRSKAVIFERGPNDTWETIKFGGTYRGGTKKFPFFQNAAYLSRAGNDASSAKFIQEIYKYFESINFVMAGNRLFLSASLAEETMMRAVSELICLADTGVTRVTMEENDAASEIRLPEGMPEELKNAILADNRLSAKFWVTSKSGNLIAFEAEDMSTGTMRLLELLPIVLHSFKHGSILVIDELNTHLHTDLVNLLLRLFHDSDINSKNAQLIFSTHDTNVLDSGNLRRDQIWFAIKDEGVSTLRSLDEYDKKTVRQDSPFEAFYRDGRLEALPRVSYAQVKNAIRIALEASEKN
jgi:AAA15 family ATPase/GTPase